jgi:hypothetical protein
MCPADSELLKSPVAPNDAANGNDSMIFEFAAPSGKIERNLRASRLVCTGGPPAIVKNPVDKSAAVP